MSIQVGPKIVYESDPNPKNSSKGTRKGKKKPQKKPDKKQKDRAVHPKPKLIVYTSRSQQFFEPDPNLKTAPNGPTRAKKAPYGVE